MWAEASPAAWHMGQLCSVTGAGHRWLHGEVAAEAMCLHNPFPSCNRWMGWKEWQGWICIPCPGTAGTSMTPQGALSINAVYFWGERRDWAKGWLASCPCPRKIAAEFWWIGTREVMLGVWPSGIYFGPDLMIKCDIIFRLTQLTDMPLRFPLFEGVKHFCCKPSKRRYCGRVEQKRLWKMCQESACALLVPKHSRA